MNKLFIIIFYILIIIKNYEFVHIRKERQAIPCESYEWQCLDKQCIDSLYVCNGVADCADLSDETASRCRQYRCPSYSFRCGYGACVKGNAACDGNKDCLDGSDESNCQVKCEPYEFQCNATQCIDNSLVCNGKYECANKADENEEICRGRHCPSYAFQCDYGGCINGQFKCNKIKDCIDGSDESSRICPNSEIGDCIVPDILYGKVRTPDGSQQLKSGTSVENLGLISITCWNNFIINGANKMLCIDGVWDNEKPQCIKRDYCTLARTASRHVKCTRNGRDVPCTDPIMPGTLAKIECAEGYEKLTGQYDRIRCTEEGEWDYSPFNCFATCGKIDTGTTFVANGESVDVYDVPWQAAIYFKNDMNLFSHICGGTIISTRFVISAAHCFWNRQTSKSFPKELFRVAVGKTRRDYNAPEIGEPQFFNLSTIEVHSDYRDTRFYYRYDIAFLLLDKSIIYQYNIKPVCLEEQKTGTEIIPDTDQIGIVAGWGMTEKLGVYSSVLKKLELSIITNPQCRNALNSEYHNFITSDKFCAGHADQRASVCIGDSGGGLVIKKLLSPRDARHYLIGIVSNGYLPYQACQNVSYTTYTLIQTYLEKIKDFELANRQDKFR